MKHTSKMVLVCSVLLALLCLGATVASKWPTYPKVTTLGTNDFLLAGSGQGERTARTINYSLFKTQIRTDLLAAGKTANLTVVTNGVNTMVLHFTNGVLMGIN